MTGRRSEKQGGSIAFERALEDYERTRSLPPEAMATVLQLLTEELAGHQPCLEIGVGTGRMALALAGGVRMVGVDLSLMMLGELRRKAGGRSPFPIAGADAVHLPFAEASFGAGLAVHVLHLIPAWRAALTELVRVVARPGVVVVDTGGSGTGWWPAVEERFCKEAGIPSCGVGLRKGDDVDGVMASLGAKVRKPEPSTRTRRRPSPRGSSGWNPASSRSHGKRTRQPGGRPRNAAEGGRPGGSVLWTSRRRSRGRWSSGPTTLRRAERAGGSPPGVVPWARLTRR